MTNNKNDYLFILTGSIIYAFGVYYFADLYNIVPGGISGIAVILKNVSENRIPLFVTNIILNIPLFIICYFQKGFQFIKKSFFCVSAVSLFLWLFKFIPIDFKIDLLSASLLYGGLSGTGLGFILKSSATSGGTDMLASIIKNKKPYLSISLIIMIADAIVILSGVAVFGLKSGLYACLSLYITTKIINLFLDGLYFAKSVFIFSDKYELISKEIMEKLQRGNTLIKGKGMYSSKDKNIIFTVVEHKELPLLQNIVSKTDPYAFFTVSDTRSVYGEGFIPIEKN